MTIEAELRGELKDALRSGDRDRKDVIRAIETEISRTKAAPGFEGEIDDGLYRTVIASYVKKMTKARVTYDDLGERGQEMATKLAFEIEYLAQWLPESLDEVATKELVAQAITDLSVDDPKHSGKVVGHIMADHKDEVDGSLVSRLVREALSA